MNDSDITPEEMPNKFETEAKQIASLPDEDYEEDSSDNDSDEEPQLNVFRKK